MDLWEWLHEATDELRKNGQGRLADLIDDLPTACCDGEHDRVESLVPEALALARAAKSPWLEVFVRHWLLQSRVLHRHDVSRDTLKQAVALIELSSRPENRDCPQGVCAVQDLCSAYGLIDGVGYAEQRLAVTEEALGRIDPSWPCFDCVSSERASALLDSGRHLEALEFCERQLAQRPENTTGLSCSRFRGLSALGRKREAAEAAEHIDLANSGASGACKKALFQCLSAARLGEQERALELLPTFETLEPEHYTDWLRCLRELGPAPETANTWRVERSIAVMQRALASCESHFTLAKVHKLAADLALQRAATFSARRHIAAARQTASRLLDAGWLLAKLELQSKELACLPALPAATSLEEAQELLGSDPERDLELLHVSGLSGAPSLVRAEARALRALGAGDEAQSVLEAAAARWPEDVELGRHLLETLLERGQHARLDELCSGAAEAPGVPGQQALWILARSLAARGDAPAVLARCLELLEREPDHHDARSLLATTLRDSGQHEAALEHLSLLVAAHEPGNWDWDRMLVATLAGRWPEVRDSAARLELPVEPDETGPIDERWGACRIRIRSSDGQEQAYFAWRTGPVTARIDHVVEPDLEQHHGDLVAFDAAPLNQEELDAHEASKQAAGEDAEPPRRPLTEYAAFKLLELGNYRAFEIDGFAPQEQQLEELKQALGEHGIVWEQRSGEHYQLDYEGQSQPATFALLGLPATCDDARAHQALLRVTQQLALRLVWPRLAEAAGDSQAATEQRALADAWGIE